MPSQRLYRYQELEDPDLDRASECVARAEQRLGGDPAHAGVLLCARGSLAYDRDDFAGARAAAEAALGAAGGDAQLEATALNLLALCCAETGDWTRAFEVRQREMAAVAGLVGDAHPDYATSLESLADLYQSVRAYAKASQLCAEVLRLRVARLGEGSRAAEDAGDDIRELGVLLAKNAAAASGRLRVCFACRQVGDGHSKCPKCRQAWWCGDGCRDADAARHGNGECASFAALVAEAKERRAAAEAKMKAKKKK